MLVAFVSALAGAACTAVNGPAPAPVASVAVSAAPAVGGAAFTCPPVDRAALEAERKTRESVRAPLATVLLSDVWPGTEVRTSDGAGAPAHDLGSVHLQHGLRPRTVMAGFGLGFFSADADWFKGKLAPALEAPLAAWDKRREELMDAVELSTLLAERANLLRAFPPAAGRELLACAETDAASAEKAYSERADAAKRAERDLASQLSAIASKNASERLLGAYLALNLVRSDDKPGRDQLLLEFRALTAEPSLAIEDRVWAWQGVAELASEVEALEQAAKLTTDTRFRMSMLANVSKLVPVDKRESRLRELIQLVEQSGIERWRLPGALQDLAELRLVAGDLAGARDAAVRCIVEVDPNEADNIYRRLCSEYLAEALPDLGAPAGVAIPEVALGPLALALMDQAIAHYDREGARHAGELLLARAPMAVEAPQVLERLRVIADEPLRSALALRATRDYGTPSAWLDAQRRRLAPQANSLEKLDKQLAALRPGDVAGSRPPADDEALEDELRQRAFQASQACAVAFRQTKVSALTVTVDSTGPRPKVSVAPNRHKALTTCFELQGARYFRSLGPRRVQFRVSEYPRPARKR